MEIIKKAQIKEVYTNSFIRKASCIGCYRDSKPAGNCPKVLK